MAKIVCLDCGKAMIVKENEVCGERIGSDGKPDNITAADLYECTECHRQVLSGFAFQPLINAYEKGYEEMKKKLEKVNKIRLYHG